MYPSVSAKVAVALAGIILSHISHLVSTFLLYELSQTISPAFTHSLPGLSGSTSFPFLVCSLYILSPAGIFLSAPYAESPFAALTFLTNVLQATALQAHFSHRRERRDLCLLTSGVIGGIATAFRSNGMLTIIVYPALALSYHVEVTLVSQMRYLIVLGISCLFIALGSIIPQALAWYEYCFGDDHHTSLKISRPIWCESWIPSIYTYVQEHYWDVGLFRYWTVSNIPLFLLATPVLSLMAISAYKSVLYPMGSSTQVTLNRRTKGRAKSQSPKTPKIPKAESAPGSDPGPTVEVIFLRALALPQLTLTVLALTIYHVQIITRISSAYPVMYFYLASLILNDKQIRILWPWHWRLFLSHEKRTSGTNGTDRKEEEKEVEKRNKRERTVARPVKKVNIGEVVVRAWICYAIVQAGLFGGFLPPA